MSIIETNNILNLNIIKNDDYMGKKHLWCWKKTSKKNKKFLTFKKERNEQSIIYWH